MRRSQIYVSSDILHALILIGKSQSDEIHKITAEDVAERLLSEGIATQYPKIAEHQKQIAKLEKELFKNVTQGLKETSEGES